MLRSNRPPLSRSHNHATLSMVVHRFQREHRSSRDRCVCHGANCRNTRLHWSHNRHRTIAIVFLWTTDIFLVQVNLNVV